MKRFLIFTALFPPLALIVFTAPDGFKNLLDWSGMAYAIAILPAWLVAVADWKFSAKPAHLRVLQTAGVGALLTGSVAFFLWDGFRELFPALMAVLVGAVPAAACSWLSGINAKSAERKLTG